MLHYQQKVDLKTGAIVGAEALLRWKHPEWGLVRPARFIPLAEETGLIVQIGEWVLREACRQNVAWQKEGLEPGVVSVNLSARQFRQEGLVRAVSRILAETGLDPVYLEMELTESMVMHNAEAAIAILQGLKSLGVALSVDDFGTGYSSLAYLKDLPIDTLKIDRSFVRDIKAGGDPGEGVIAQAIISLGHSLDLKVIAEGVETDAQLDYLRQARLRRGAGLLLQRAGAAGSLPQAAWRRALRPPRRMAGSIYTILKSVRGSHKKRRRHERPRPEFSTVREKSCLSHLFHRTSA